MTYHNAIKYIKNAPNIAPKNSEARARINRLFSALGDPQKKIKYIRLAGSNGKSVCAQMMTSILNEAGILSGCVTMQISSEFRENVRVGGAPMTVEETAQYVGAVARAVTRINTEDKEKDSAKKANDVFAPTAHEIMLCVAMLIFNDKKCELVFIESDHGTEDPSRFLHTPLSTIICGAIPNDSREISKIHSYIQRGITEIVSTPQNNSAFKVIQDTCQKINCRLSFAVTSNSTISSINLRGTKFSYRNDNYTLKTSGRFHVMNAMLAIESAKMLKRHNYPIDENHIVDGLAKATLPAKFEVISISPTIIIDSTHTPIAIETVCNSLEELKKFTGTNIRLCLTDEDLCPYYTDALLRREYDIESVMAIASDSESQGSASNNSISLYKTPKQIAKAALSGLDENSLLLVSGRSDVAEKIRYEILGILGFR